MGYEYAAATNLSAASFERLRRHLAASAPYEVVGNAGEPVIRLRFRESPPSGWDEDAVIYGEDELLVVVHAADRAPRGLLLEALAAFLRGEGVVARFEDA